LTPLVALLFKQTIYRLSKLSRYISDMMYLFCLKLCIYAVASLAIATGYGQE